MRMTEQLRTRIVENLLKHRFKSEEDDIHSERVKIGDAIYRAAFSASDRKKMDALPDGWLPTTQSADVVTGIHYHRFSMSEEKRIPYSRVRARCLLSISATDKLATRISECVSRFEKVRADKKKAADEAHALIGKATTVARLLKDWPELEPFVPTPDSPTLPSVTVKQANATFKLPVSA